MGTSEFIRGPKWRTRTTSRRRARAAALTFAVATTVGLFLLVLVIWTLDRLGAPIWIATMPWWLPTLGVVGWALGGPSPAIATDDDDDSWGGFAIRRVLVGEGERRPLPVRVVTAVAFGAPVTWAMLIFGVLALAGLFEF